MLNKVFLIFNHLFHSNNACLIYLKKQKTNILNSFWFAFWTKFHFLNKWVLWLSNNWEGKKPKGDLHCQRILSIFPASVHRFYANLHVFVNFNPFLYNNDQFALQNLNLNLNRIWIPRVRVDTWGRFYSISSVTVICSQNAKKKKHSIC